MKAILPVYSEHGFKCASNGLSRDPVSFREKQDFGNRLDQTYLLKAGQSVFLGLFRVPELLKKKCYLKSNAVQLPMIFLIHI